MSSSALVDDFLRHLHEQGGRAGNGQLSARLGLTEEAYTTLRGELLARGTIVTGRGRGGTVALANGASPPHHPPPAKPPQPDLLAAAPATSTLPGTLRSQVNQIRNAFWTGGISNPIEVIEQITYLLFIRRLDDPHTLEERKSARLARPMERRALPEGQDPRGRACKDLR